MSKNNSMWNTSAGRYFFFCIKYAFPAKNVKRYVLTFLKSANGKCISRPKCVRGASEAIGKPKTLELRDRQYTPVASSHTTPCHAIPYHTISHQGIPYHTIKLSTPVSSSKVRAPEQEICRLYRIHRIYRINKTRAKQESRCRIYTKHAHDIYLGETIFSTVLRTLPWEQACCDIRSKDTFSKFGKHGFNSILLLNMLRKFPGGKKKRKNCLLSKSSFREKWHLCWL